MKKLFAVMGMITILILDASAQKTIKAAQVPAAVKSAVMQHYPDAKSITWETEKGNYEANWGGKSGEDHSVLLSPKGNIVESVAAIAVSELPLPVIAYVKSHYKNAKITEAGKVTDANGKITYEAEVNKKDIIFDENGKFIKID